MSALAAFTGLASGCRCNGAGFLGDAGERATGGENDAARPAWLAAAAAFWRIASGAVGGVPPTKTEAASGPFGWSAAASLSCWCCLP